MMASMYIESWIKAKESISFFLPDGAEARPFDNQYSVVDVSVCDNETSIKLSGDIEFLLIGDLRYSDEACNLIVTGFSRLIYRVRDIVIREFTKGELCFSGF
jgi:hypothetical protein